MISCHLTLGVCTSSVMSYLGSYDLLKPELLKPGHIVNYLKLIVKKQNKACYISLLLAQFNLKAMITICTLTFDPQITHLAFVMLRNPFQRIGSSKHYIPLRSPMSVLIIAIITFQTFNNWNGKQYQRRCQKHKSFFLLEHSGKISDNLIAYWIKRRTFCFKK